MSASLPAAGALEISGQLTPTAVDGFRSRSDPWLLTAHELVVTDPSMVAVAGEHMRDIGALLKEIAGALAPIIKTAHATHRAACDFKRELSAELEEADRTIREKVRCWEIEQRTEQRRIDAAAEAEALAERRKKESEAAALRAMGETGLAAASTVEARAVHIPRPVKPPSVRAVGVNTRAVYKARVTDLRALLQGVLEGKIPMGAVGVNQAMLNAQARSLKMELRWPGVEVFEDVVVARRS